MAVATFKGLQSGRLFGYLARRPGNRATTARCPRGRAGTRRVQEVGARGRRRQERREMVDERLSAADRALRTRITQLSVHIPCGGLRGPLQRTSRPYPGLPIRWQSCPDEDSPQKWAGLRCLTTVRPVHHLLQGDRRRNVPLVVAGLRGLPRYQRIHRIPLGFPPVRAGQAQPDERNRRPRGVLPRGQEHRSNVSWRS